MIKMELGFGEEKEFESINSNDINGTIGHQTRYYSVKGSELLNLPEKQLQCFIKSFGEISPDKQYTLIIKGDHQFTRLL